MDTWSCCLTTVMTMRIAILRDTRRKLGGALGFNRLIHSVPQSPPLAGSIDHGIQSLKPVLPEFCSPTFSFGGSMELMAVPKRKVRYLHNFSSFWKDVEFYWLMFQGEMMWVQWFALCIIFLISHSITFVMVLFVM